METAFAFEKAGAETHPVHIGELLRREKTLGDYQIMAFPGGFTYGDDLGAGKVLANEISIKLGEDIQRFIEAGGLIIGICNGFQVLVKSGILPGPLLQDTRQKATLTNNDSARFECRWVHLGVNRSSKCIFTMDIERMYLPVAHGEGKLIAAGCIMQDNLNAVLHYIDDNGDSTMSYPANPNGSQNSIAGICDSTGRVFALMPHPERYIRGSQSPGWTREGSKEHGDGLKIFQNAVNWVKHL
jgi:phosphoribosylformylglycinamidine synthase